MKGADKNYKANKHSRMAGKAKPLADQGTAGRYTQDIHIKQTRQDGTA